MNMRTGKKEIIETEEQRKKLDKKQSLDEL